MSRETAAHGGEEPPREPSDSEEQGRQEPEQEAEDPVDARLRVYLGRFVEAQGGRMKAADALGVNHKTLARGLDEPGPLTVWLQAALFVKALEDGVATLAEAGQAPEDAGAAVPSGRIGELAAEVRGVAEVLRGLTGAVEQLRDEHGERLQALEERLAPVIGAPRGASGNPSTSPGGQPAAPTVVSGEPARSRDDAPGAERTDEGREGAEPDGEERPPAPAIRGATEPASGRRPAARPRRAHPDLVTLEPEEGEELVYGEEVTPLIAEWREGRAAFIDRGNSRVERATAWVRMCERTLTLIGEHELTLPLADYPWDRFERQRELERSEQSLRDARRELRRARWWRGLRLALTFGQWRR
ncbi:MAG: hypothetical protein OXG95_11820 [Chloroflexi bacterium]|nr:hypothetical protein [Chloroflexota bacterium]